MNSRHRTDMAEVRGGPEDDADENKSRSYRWILHEALAMLKKVSFSRSRSLKRAELSFVEKVIVELAAGSDAVVGVAELRQVVPVGKAVAAGATAY